MNVEPRPRVHQGPPRRSATAADTLFALALAALLLALAGGLLAAAGGVTSLARLLPGAAPSSAAPEARPPAAVGPIRAPLLAPQSASPAVTPGPITTPLPSPDPSPIASPSPTLSGPFTMNLYREGVFVHEVDDQTCVRRRGPGHAQPHPARRGRS